MHLVALSYIKLGMGLIRLVRWTISDTSGSRCLQRLGKKKDAGSGSAVCVKNSKTTINVCFSLRVFNTLRLLLPMAMLIVFWYMPFCEISKNGEFLL